MKNQMEICEEKVVKGVSVNKKKWEISIVCVIIALVSYFIISSWATSVESYSEVINTLNGIQKKALGLTGTSTLLATGAAAIPGEATTPIANKLADVAGYMVIVYVAIMLEKYLLTLTGFVAFKILLPIGFVMIAIGSFLQSRWKEFVYRLSVKCIVLGILLWCLVPTSAWVTNWINTTYEASYNIDEDLVEESKIVEDEEKDSDTEKEKGSKFSFADVYNSFMDKVNNVTDKVGEVVSNKLEDYQEALNQMIEAVSVMIVTTCVIPILVMVAFLGILRMVTGLNLPIPTVQSLPKASKGIEKRMNKMKED